MDEDQTPAQALNDAEEALTAHIMEALHAFNKRTGAYITGITVLYNKFTEMIQGVHTSFETRFEEMDGRNIEE